MFSPRVNQSLPKLNVPKKIRVPNSSTSTSNGPPRSAKGIFRQWGDPPPPPPSARTRTCERTQSLPPVKRRPGSADPRFRRRIDKIDSNLTIDPSNTSIIGDYKKASCKSENVTPRIMKGDGEKPEDIYKQKDDIMETLHKAKEVLLEDIISNTTNIAEKKEHYPPIVEQTNVTESETVITKLSDYELPNVNFNFDKERLANEPITKIETPRCADENLESKFLDHTFYSTLRTKYVPCLEQAALSGADIEDELYANFLKDKIELAAARSLMSIPVYNVQTEIAKTIESDEDDDIPCNTSNSNMLKLYFKSRKRDMTLICGSAVIFGASIWYYIGSDVEELSKTISWLQPVPEPSMFEYITSAGGILLESCVSVVGFVFNILTVSLEQKME
ncbi:hypothetical protein CBL_04378 [Carabus blaptoides fortunei]